MRQVLFYLTFLGGVGSVFADQIIPLKALPYTSMNPLGYVWLPNFAWSSYVDYQEGMLVTDLGGIEQAIEDPDAGIVLADPTLPLSYIPVASTANNSEEVGEKLEFKLTQILISKNRKVAVINNVVVKEGEWVSEAQVLQITPTKVTLTKKGTEIEVSFNEKPIRGVRKYTDDAQHEKQKK